MATTTTTSNTMSKTLVPMLSRCFSREGACCRSGRKLAGLGRKEETCIEIFRCEVHSQAVPPLRHLFQNTTSNSVRPPKEEAFDPAHEDTLLASADSSDTEALTSKASKVYSRTFNVSCFCRNFWNILTSLL